MGAIVYFKRDKRDQDKIDARARQQGLHLKLLHLQLLYYLPARQSVSQSVSSSSSPPPPPPLCPPLPPLLERPRK